MARTTRAAVKNIIDTSLTDGQVDAFLSDANTWVTDFLGGEGLSPGRLTIIEKYLTAHYITLRDPRLRDQTQDDIRETYQRDTQVTEYVRQAAAEDPTGIVKAELILQDTAATVKWRKGVYDPD